MSMPVEPTDASKAARAAQPPDPRDEDAFAPALTQNKPFARRHSTYASSSAASVSSACTHDAVRAEFQKHAAAQAQPRMATTKDVG